MHPLTAISIAIVSSPHLWEMIHAAPASTTAGSPPGPFDFPACLQVCQTSDHGNATCTDACQRLLPCWMYCNHQFEQEDEDHRKCLLICVNDLKNTTSSARSNATPTTADLVQVFPHTLLATRKTTNVCSEDVDGHVICADQPQMKVPRGARDQCYMDCDEIQNAEQTYLCKMNCTDDYSIGDGPPNVYTRHADIDIAESSTVTRRDDAKDDDKDCNEYCNANSSGGSADEIRDRCSKACNTLDVCKTACEAQGPKHGELCVVNCIMIGSDAPKDSTVVARDYDRPSTTINLTDFLIPSTATTFADTPTMTSSGSVPLGTMEITVAAGSSLGCQGWQVVWVVVVAGLAGGMFLW